MIKTHLIFIDNENSNSTSTRLELKGTPYEKLDMIDIKMEYFRLHLDEVEVNLFKQSELIQLNDEFHGRNPFVQEDFWDLDLNELDEDGNKKYVTKLSDFSFKPKERYLVLGNESFYYVKKLVHLGPRNEVFSDYVRADYLMVMNEALFKFTYLDYEKKSNFITENEYNSMLPHLEVVKQKIRGAELISGISKKTNRPYYIFKFDAIRSYSDEVDRFLTLEESEYLKTPPKLQGWKLVRTTEDINKTFDYWLSKPKGTEFGFDYETSGFPMETHGFFHMGLGIADLDGFAAYYDLEWMQSVGGNFEVFKSRLREFCEKFDDDVITYNSSFEMSATYKLLNKIYLFSEGATINKLNGLVEKNFSLKYTAMTNLGVKSWDDDFDYLLEILPEVFDVVDEWNNETKELIQSNEYWKEITERYPEDIDEFYRLFELYWGDEFKCIPSTILGKYCTLDSFYTLKLKEESDKLYSNDAWTCYNNNMRLSALLRMCGSTVDIQLRDHMREFGMNVICYCKLNVLKFYLTSKMKYYNYGSEIYPVITQAAQYGLNPWYSKEVIQECFDETKPQNLDTKLLDHIYGAFSKNIQAIIFDYVDELDSSIFRKRRLFSDLDEAIWEFYKVVDLGNKGYEYEVSGKLHKFSKDLADYNQYFIDQANLKKVDEILSQLSVNKQVSQVTCEGTIMNLDELSEWMDGSVFNMNSPANTQELQFAVFEHFFNEYHYLLVMEEFDDELLYKHVEDDLIYNREFIRYYLNGAPIVMQTYRQFQRKAIPQIMQLMKTDKQLVINAMPYDGDKTEFLDILKDRLDKYLEQNKYVEVEPDWAVNSYYGIDTVNLLNTHFNSGMEALKVALHKYEFHKDLLHLYADLSATGLFNHLKLGNKYEPDELTILPEVQEFDECFTDYCFKSHFDWCLRNQFRSYSTEEQRHEVFDHIDEIDVMSKSMAGLAKFEYCYLICKKMTKQVTTYLDGQFYKYNYRTNGDDLNLVSTEKRHGEDGEVIPGEEDFKKIKMYSTFWPCSKKSKRWAASLHTVPSNSEVKRCLGTPKGYLLSYFDISGAEIRAISYISNDEFMLNNYQNKVDPYINLAELLEPGNTKEYYKSIRWIYKIILLGSLYGMGIDQMAENAGLEIDDAIQKHAKMFENMRGIARLIDEKGSYCEENHGQVESYLGDKLEMEYAPDRWRRLGINQFVQNIASVSLGDGFFNIIRESIKNTDMIIRPVNVVHDSSQNYFEAKNLFKMRDFYYEHLSEYLWNKYHVRYEFDLEIGKNYYDMVELSQSDRHHITLTGNCKSLSLILSEINESELQYRITSVKDKKGNDLEFGDRLVTDPNFKEKLESNYFASFEFDNKGNKLDARWNIDSSKYTIDLEELI